MAPSKRRSAKVLLLDPDGRVLLFSGVDPAAANRPRFWVPVGGGVEQNETVAQAAIREVEEETGLRLADLGAVVMTRHVDFTFEGTFYDQDETYYAVRTDTFVPDTAGWTAVERRAMSDAHWWSVDELRTTTETVFPEGLAELIEQLLLGMAGDGRGQR
jgi:8-oxo-dGTP pyrophosphatase MutT (NUDIX family)